MFRKKQAAFVFLERSQMFKATSRCYQQEAEQNSDFFLTFEEIVENAPCIDLNQYTVGKLDTKEYMYYGQISDKVPHGLGIIYFKDLKVIYEGQFKHKKAHGFGKKINQNGIVEQGYIVNGNMKFKD
jgi:hypothetical protein